MMFLIYWSFLCFKNLNLFQNGSLTCIIDCPIAVSYIITFWLPMEMTLPQIGTWYPFRKDPVSNVCQFLNTSMLPSQLGKSSITSQFSWGMILWIKIGQTWDGKNLTLPQGALKIVNFTRVCPYFLPSLHTLSSFFDLFLTTNTMHSSGTPGIVRSGEEKTLQAYRFPKALRGN